MTLKPNLSVMTGLGHLAARLDPILSDRRIPNLGDLPWATVLTELD